MVGSCSPGSGDEVEQPLDLDDGERDESRVLGWYVVWAGRFGWQGGRLAAHGRGGYRADRERGHGEGDVPADRGVEADLAVVESKVALAGLEILLHLPTHPGHFHQGGQGDRAALGHVGGEVGQFGRVGQASTYEQMVAWADGSQPPQA